MVALVNLLSQISLALFGILPGNYSGITHIADNQYAVVDDKDQTDGFKILSLDLDPVKGKVRGASMSIPLLVNQRHESGKATYRDSEGIAYFPSRNTIFVSGEADQRILEYTLDGVPTGRELQIPASMGRDRIASNLGFESLTYNEKTQLFWTTTESTLLNDGERSSLSQKEVNNLLRLQSFSHDLLPEAQYAYVMDKPATKGNKGTFAHGVPEMLALDDGRLIVMERELYAPRYKVGSTCRIKLYVVDPTHAETISDEDKLSQLAADRFLPKTLLAEFKTRLQFGRMNLANYEGMCLGPKLEDGSQTVILISDSQSGTGNRFYHLKDYVRIIILSADQQP